MSLSNKTIPSINGKKLKFTPSDALEIYRNIYYDEHYGPYKFIKFNHGEINSYSVEIDPANNSGGISHESISEKLNYTLKKNQLNNSYMAIGCDDSTKRRCTPRTCRLVVILPIEVAKNLIELRKSYFDHLKSKPSAIGFKTLYDELSRQLDNDLAENLFFCPIKNFNEELKKLNQERRTFFPGHNASCNFTLDKCDHGSCIRSLFERLSLLKEFENHCILLIEEKPNRYYNNYDLSIPGGKRNEKEAPYAVAKREFCEETGIDIQLSKFEVDPNFQNYGILYGQGIRYMEKSIDYYFNLIHHGEYDIIYNDQMATPLILKST